jgi:hypothetical protein
VQLRQPDHILGIRELLPAIDNSRSRVRLVGALPKSR